MSLRRKALFVLPADAPGGAERVMATAALELGRRGQWDIRVVTLSRRLEVSFLDQLGGHVDVQYGKGSGGFPSEWAALTRLPGETFDLAFSSHFRVNAALSMARSIGLLKTRRLVTRESTVLADRSSGTKLAAYKLGYQVYGAQDAIIAQTAYMGRRVEGMLPASARGKIHVVPNPVDVDAIRKNAAEPLPPHLAARLAGRPHIAWCGRLIDIKNPLLALDTIEYLRQTGAPETGLLMIGAGPLEKQLRQEIERRSLNHAVLLSGHQANPAALLRGCVAGLLTSRREGFPNVLLEMMAVGLPRIVSTNCAGDLASLSGVRVVDQHTPDALAKALSSAPSTFTYEHALAPRTPAAFVDKLLGIPQSP